MGADYYEVNIYKCTLLPMQQESSHLGVLLFQTEADKKLLAENGGIPIGIGKNSHIRKAIIDKNARIGDNVKVFQTDVLTVKNILVYFFTLRYHIILDMLFSPLNFCIYFRKYE
jgi:ADP-glucose pyrophosphorylase